MSEHLAAEQWNALADGELPEPQLAAAQKHLAECAACTSAALAASLTKAAAARAGMRHAAPREFQERMRKLAAGGSATVAKSSRTGLNAWSSIAALLLLGVGLFVAQRGMEARSDNEALVAEVADQHVAAMTGDAPPEVISSDRHTVKPWFQGKLPFSFNLPDKLPGDTTLDGADMTYLHGQPTAQLLYSIGKHHVSVFLRQRNGGSPAWEERAGFHVASVPAGELEVVAVSDVEPRRLKELATLVAQAQAAK